MLGMTGIFGGYSHSDTALVGRGPFDVVDDRNLDRIFAGDEPEAHLFFERAPERRSIRSANGAP